MPTFKYNFEKLEIWKQAIQLSIAIYELTKSFPNDEKFRIISQLRRANWQIDDTLIEKINLNSFLIQINKSTN